MKPSKILNDKLQPKTQDASLSSFQDLRFEAIGTHWHIIIWSPNTKAAMAALDRRVRQRIEFFDRQYSRFRDDSLVSQMAQKAGTYILPDDAKPLLDLYYSLYGLTKGSITPLIGQLLSDAGYDRSYSFVPGRLNDTPAWDTALDYAFPTLHIKRPVLLDFGAAGKGYLVDIIADVLRTAGVQSFCINAGGDIFQQQPPVAARRIGLEHPDSLKQVVGVATIINQSICGSAGNRRSWGDYTHIMNPSSKRSPHHLRSVWVVADSALLADGLATALFFTDAGKLTDHYAFEYAYIREDYSLEHSAQFPAEFFTEERARI
jgi:thiamine biosynthesis lipoprotein